MGFYNLSGWAIFIRSPLNVLAIVRTEMILFDLIILLLA
jgi:hypothetical protein